MDIGIAAGQFCLHAADLEPGACMIGWFNEKKVKGFLNIPASKRAMLIITLGYPEGKLRKKNRKETSEILSFNNYNN